MTIFNLTQHLASPEQVMLGVVDVPSPRRERLHELLTFTRLPDEIEIGVRVQCLLSLVEDLGAKQVMLGGAPYLMSSLEWALTARHVKVMYSFTERVSVEEVLPDGTTKKTSQFRHCGWVTPPAYPTPSGDLLDEVWREGYAARGY